MLLPEGGLGWDDGGEQEGGGGGQGEEGGWGRKGEEGGGDAVVVCGIALVLAICRIAGNDATAVVGVRGAFLLLALVVFGGDRGDRREEVGRCGVPRIPMDVRALLTDQVRIKVGPM